MRWTVIADIGGYMTVCKTREQIGGLRDFGDWDR